ncbi:uncharacterized protein BDV17DRAFT_299288 [Aspergillus undulatus]|uniref:uncharacterized protein n=1 Tax=Aspergillus undulatus TaxID=1810928 RepID=UPI003CCDE8EB
MPTKSGAEIYLFPTHPGSHVQNLLNPEAEAASPSTQQPTYAIAHRVLRPGAVTAALSHSVNALEVDLTPWDTEWWADHDGTDNSAVSDDHLFFWLDIKDPDYCKEPERGCSVETLRESLLPAGVRALYGFFETEKSRGLAVMKETLRANEAICLSREASEVLNLYGDPDSGITVEQRIMDYGYSQLDQGFSDCHEADSYTCAELRIRQGNCDKGLLGKVFGWTSTQGDTKLVDMLLESATVDGIIYGFQDADCTDDIVPKAAIQGLVDFVTNHPDSRRIATIDDAPW